MKKYSEYGPSLLRLTIGMIFLFTGISKLMNPAGITGMLGNLGFPGAAFWAWIVILSEMLGGLALLAGWKVKYAVWPLVVIMVVAVLMVSLQQDSINWVNVFFHLITTSGLISLALTGPGKIAVEKE